MRLLYFLRVLFGFDRQPGLRVAAVGALAAFRNAVHRLPFWPALGWGLAWGAAASLVAALVESAATPQGAAAWPGLPTALSWWISLLYLALAGTVLAFSAFLTLQQRLGPGPAATIGVMTPIVALLVSTAFEGYRPGLWTLAGGALALAGNALMLRRGAGAARRLEPADAAASAPASTGVSPPSAADRAAG